MAQSDFLISTDQNIQKEYVNIPMTLAVPGDFAYHNFTINHDLGYIPSARVWYEVGDKWYPLALTQLQDGASGDFLQQTGAFSLTTNQLIVSMLNFSGSTSNIRIWGRIYLDD